jgi:hypothetical protein
MLYHPVHNNGKTVKFLEIQKEYNILLEQIGENMIPNRTTKNLTECGKISLMKIKNMDKILWKK